MNEWRYASHGRLQSPRAAHGLLNKPPISHAIKRRRRRVSRIRGLTAKHYHFKLILMLSFSRGKLWSRAVLS